MPAHCVTIVTPDPATRHVSFAAEVGVIGVSAGGLSNGFSDATVCDRGSRRVSFADDVEVIGESDGDASKGFRKVSFAEGVEIIPVADRSRSVSFAADVQVIGQSQGDVSCLTNGEEGTMMIDAYALFGANESATAHGETTDILLDAIEGAEEGTVSSDDGPQGIHNAPSSSLGPVAPPPRRSSLHWRLAAPQQQSPRYGERIPPLMLAPPPQASRLFRERIPPPMRGRLLQPNRAALSSTLAPLALPPPLLPLPGVGVGQAIPRSPPPPYTDNDMRTEDADDDELIAYRNPPPAYDWHRPPPYISVLYPEGHGDIVLENLFTGVGVFFRGVGMNFVEAWRSMGNFEPVEEVHDWDSDSDSE